MTISIPNHYRFNKVNIKLFYGEDRISIRNQLVRGLANGQSFGVVGGRRIGKTTLLRATDKQLTDYTEQVKKYGIIILSVYVDIQALVNDTSSASDFYESIANIIDTKLSQTVEIPLSYSVRDFQTFKSYLIQIKEQFTESYELNIVFIFDEIELLTTASWGEIFFNNWRALLSNTEELQDNVAAVFCGASEMRTLAENVGSPLQNILNRVFQLKLFSQTDVQQLMSHPINYEWSPNIVENIYKITGGHPCLIQYIMEEVCNYDFHQAEEIISIAVNNFVSTQNYIFESWWNKFDSVSRIIYDRLHRSNSFLSVAELAPGFQRLEVKQSLETLSHTGVIHLSGKTDESIQAAIAGTLFKDWYIRYGNLEPKDSIDHVRRLILDVVEPQLKSVIARRLDTKYGTAYLQKQLSKNYLDIWRDICQRLKCNNPSLSNQEIMKKLYFRESFIILFDRDNWNECADLFLCITQDKKKLKNNLLTIKDHLTFVRNQVCHTEPKLTTRDLILARIYCEQLLEALSDKA